MELTKVIKTEYAPTEYNNIITEEAGDGEVTEACRSNSVLSASKSNDLSENLVQLLTDVNDLKVQINYFADEKDRDENLIKYVSSNFIMFFLNRFLNAVYLYRNLKCQRQKLKKQIIELRWQLQVNSTDDCSTESELL